MKMKLEELSFEEEITMEEVASIVSRFFDISKKDLFFGNRKTIYSYPRHLYHYLLVKCCGFSQAKSGILSKKDHASVGNSCRKIKGFLDIGDPLVKRHIQKLETILYLYNDEKDVGSLIEKLRSEKKLILKKR